MTVDSVVAVLRAHLSKEGISLGKDGSALEPADEAWAIRGIADLILDVVPNQRASWDDEITREIPSHTLSRLRRISVSRPGNAPEKESSRKG